VASDHPVHRRWVSCVSNPEDYEKNVSEMDLPEEMSVSCKTRRNEGDTR
jgi:hypothetical protein